MVRDAFLSAGVEDLRPEQSVIEQCRAMERIPLEVVRRHPCAVQGMRQHGFPVSLALFKRAVDLLFALLFGLVILPLIPFVALAIRLDSDGPVLYSQKRLGQHGHLFRIYKFRSMVTDAEAAGAQFAAHNDSRVTRVGKLMRKTRIDEIPQLWNVLRGDMSIVGPRPERPEHMEKIAQEIPEFSLRLAVKPGLTGWAQTKYRYAGTLDELREKLEYDLYYIQFANIWMEILILLRTVRVVLGSKGQ